MSSDLQQQLDAAFTAHKSGDLPEASRLYRDILKNDPLHPDVLHMLGVIAKQQGNNELALKLIEVALGQRTTMPLAWHNRALLLRILGRKDEALQSAEQAVALDPNFADAWDMIGFLLRDKREFEKSRDAHARAVTLRPDDLKLKGNYALLLLATHDYQKAYRVMREIEAKDPNFLCHTMANILKSAGHTDRAIPYFQRSRETLADNHEVRVTEAMARLQIGDFTEGWALWETRPSLGARFTDIPFWKGEAVGHLLVHEDQGMGDALQCARYIPGLQKFAKKISIAVTKPLKKIFETSFPDCEVLTLDDPAPPANARIRMLSLPAFFKATDKNIPATLPYLKTRGEWQKPWTERLTPVAQPRIGLVWGGNPDHLNDRARSISSTNMAPLLQTFGKNIVSLQKGVQKSGVDLTSLGVFDADSFLDDFSDTAGLLEELDLLISVDTSVVHLAGGMGRPVWLLLPFDSDWRWFIGREDSPWYPSMRIFRQQAPRQWPEVIGRVGAELQRFIDGDKNVLKAPPWDGECLRHNPKAIPLE